MDRFQEMQTFMQVVDAGTFIAAAEPLGLSKAAVSRHVAELESRLKIRLLNRTTRRLSLTEEGELFYLRCKEILGTVASAEAELSSRTGEAIGLLRVSAPVSFGNLHLGELWGDFKSLHPKITFDVVLSDRVIDIVEEGFDLAVRIGVPQSSSLISRRLATTRVVACASPRYLAARGTPEHPGDLAAHDIVAYSLWSQRDDWEFQGPGGPVRVHTTPCLRANSGDTCRAIALAHQGIILQPTFLVGEDLARGDLVELFPAYRSLALDVCAVYGSRKHLAPKVRLLIDFLAERLASAPWVN
jgi:DNA-binding transcriptional LysR family regulator